MTHDDINAAIAYGMVKVDRYKRALEDTVAVWYVVVRGGSDDLFTELRSPHSAVNAIRQGAICVIRPIDGVVLAQKRADDRAVAD